MVADRPDYQEFLQQKTLAVPDAGFEVPLSEINAKLFDWQKEIVRWALRRGRAAIFAECGLGKTAMQLEWAKHVCRHTEKPVLILAPLAVAQQTQREGEKFGIPVTVCRSGDDMKPGINITNYELWNKFPSLDLGGLVIDESSVLKGDGPLRKGLTDVAQGIPYRLAATATPAPNDTEELINHAEFLGIMLGKEILALYFTQDGNTTHKWRLKGHAVEDFWRWMAGWSVALRKPSDLGYSDEGYILPPLRFHQHTVEASTPQDKLFQDEARGIQEQRRVRRETLASRVARCAELVNGSDEPWLVWCGLNDEGKALTEAIPGAVEIAGAHSREHKERAILGFLDGSIRVLVTKPEVAGFGLNLQHCAREAFVGLGNSFELYYQAIRRCWRFGQTREVECHIITSEADGPIVRNIERKEQQAAEMMDQLVKHLSVNTLAAAGRERMEYAEDVASGRDWRVLLGDCVLRTKEIASESIGLSVFSPPFPSMYTYTNSPHDMGNTATFEEMLEQFSFLLPELFRVTMPGRSCCIHLTQAVAFKGIDGYVGLKDFRGRTIAAMEAAGWIYHGEHCIDKNPQLKAIRTKDRGLLFKTLATDASLMHAALADYLLKFVKPGDNPYPIRAGQSQKYGNPDGWISQDEWIRWARPVWYAADFAPDNDGISETDVLNVNQARETNDERHLAPLQLGVIERAVKLYTNPGELVFSPFAGIGSEGYQALLLKRRFVGIELKRSYWQQAARNLRRAEGDTTQLSLADLMADECEPAGVD